MLSKMEMYCCGVIMASKSRTPHGPSSLIAPHIYIRPILCEPVRIALLQSTFFVSSANDIRSLLRSAILQCKKGQINKQIELFDAMAKHFENFFTQCLPD